MITRNTTAYWEASKAGALASQHDGELDLVCCEVRRETHGVKSFFFKRENASQFKFSPGQFITLELNIDGEIINRSYTISSPPTRPHTLSITVKRTARGIVSNWLHDNMQVGLKVVAFGPHGEFTTANIVADKYLFLSAGSGVTPLMSMTRTFHELAENQDVVFVHSARSIADIIFRKELDLIAFNQPNFSTTFICESITGDECSTESKSNVLAGRLSLDTLKGIAPDFNTREIFTCGPTPYMAAVRSMLVEAGFDMSHYHEESFSFDAFPVEIQSDISDVSGVAVNEHAVKSSGNEQAHTLNSIQFSVEFTKSETTVNCAPDQFILNAAAAAGVRLPSACSKGVCGTCKSKLISGQVDMKHGGGIRQREIDQGMILICCSKPLSNLVIEK